MLVLRLGDEHETARIHDASRRCGGRVADCSTPHQQGKQPTIEFLGASVASWSSWAAAFVERLRELK